MMKITYLIPCYNEEENIELIINEIKNNMQNREEDYELLFVDDGSYDNTYSKIKSCKDDKVKYIKLSRNFGKEIAITAGLRNVNSDAVIIMDADLQHPINIAIEMIEKFKQGYDNVIARRVKRKEGIIKNVYTNVFYNMLSRNSKFKITPNTGDFRLMSKKVVDSLNMLDETSRYMKGLYYYVGYNSIFIDYVAQKRYKGKSKFKFKNLSSLALDGITSFTSLPLKLSTTLGFIVSICAFIYAIYVILRKIFIGEVITGYPTIMVSILFLGGVQLLSIGILGEYIGRVFMEAKKRPLYFIEESNIEVNGRKIDEEK